jgi:hypothetical protein
MKTRVILLIVCVLAQLALALFPVIPGLKTLLPAEPTQREQLEWQIEFIGYSFAVLTACVGLFLVLQEYDRKQFEKALKSVFPQISIQRLRDDEFYTHFLAAAKTAHSSVNIMYLSPRAPTDTNDAERLAYYSDILNVIKKRKEVRFNRIVRVTPRTKQWIAELLNDLRGCPNAYVTALKDRETADNPLSLSTQIIDQQKTWLVALSSHERKGNYRDVYVESQILAEALQLYYDRTWDRCDELLNAGRITTAGERFLSQISGQ